MIESVRNPFNVHVARALLLIDAYTTRSTGLRGWDTLARADFLVRFPTVLQYALEQRGVEMPLSAMPTATEQAAAAGMPLRYQFGPWDTRYYPVVARLVGTRLVQRRHDGTSPVFRSTDAGRAAARQLGTDGWHRDQQRAAALARHMRLSGHALTERIEVAINALETSHVPLTS